MYRENVIPSSVAKRISTFMIVVGPLVTLAITPWFNYDPINLGKGLALSSLTFAGFGLLIPYFNEIQERLGKPLVYTSGFFLLFLFAPLVLTNAPTSQQIWGQFGRATGIVTYVSLIFLFLLSAVTNTKDHYKKVVFSLIVTQALMTAYCLLQLMKKDPIKWSAYSTFGTLGNVNFLSGFMGIAVVVSLILATDASLKLPTRLFLLVLSVIDIYIVATTDSIQGLVALAVGFAIYLAFFSWKIGRPIFFSYMAIFAASLVSLVMALFDKGPLKSIIYQVTIVYRADYMHAGFKMLMHHPFTGVGIDSYDDWYRSERGVISAFRTSLNRTANTAHNVMLDLGSGGGFPLLIAYLTLLALVVFAIYRGLKSGLVRNSYFLALICSWIAYQVQASVSINQIGVGVWGWILGGAIIGFERMNRGRDIGKPSESSPDSQSRKGAKTKQKKVGPNTPPPLAVILSVVGLGVGFTLSFIPLRADMNFRSASSQGRLDLMISATNGFATNSFLIAQANEAALRNKYQDQARALNDRLISRFPRNLYGWQARLSLSGLSESERATAVSKIKEIDPNLGICAEVNPSDRVRNLLFSLPPRQQYELARGWALLPPGSNFKEGFKLANLDQAALGAKIRSFCGV